MSETELKPWKTLESKSLFCAEPWIRLSAQQVRLPDGRIIDDYYRLDLPEYAVVVAQTDDGKVIVERQYRHGIGKVCLVLPGGMIKEGESPLAAAGRELLEETGYVCYNWRSLGSFVCNANYGCGKAHIFAAGDARQVATPDSGDLEEIEILLMEPSEIVQAIRRGEITALGAIAAVALALNPLLNSTELTDD